MSENIPLRRDALTAEILLELHRRKFQIMFVLDGGNSIEVSWKRDHDRQHIWQSNVSHTRYWCLAWEFKAGTTSENGNSNHRLAPRFSNKNLQQYSKIHWGLSMKHDVYCNWHWAGCNRTDVLRFGLARKHTCELPKNHEGEHKCWCGARSKKWAIRLKNTVIIVGAKSGKRKALVEHDFARNVLMN